MGIVLAFVVGYVVGARAGQQGFEELVESMRAVRQSREFQGLVDAARSHLSNTLGELSEKLEGASDVSAQGVFDRVKRLFEPTSAESGGTGPVPGAR